MKTSNTVPGHIVIRVLSTNRVLKLMRFSAPILREDASVNSLLCNNITLHIKYNLKNIGNDNGTSYGTDFDPIPPPLLANFVVQMKR